MRAWLMLVWSLAGLGLVGCAGYRLQGQVVQGMGSSVRVVADKEDRSGDDGKDTTTGAFGSVVAGAQVTLVLDPSRASREVVAQGVTDPDGRFDLPVDLPGVGFLMHDLQLIVQRKGFVGVQQSIEPPGADERLYVELEAGRDGLGDTRSFLEQTLQDAEPYLER